MIWLMVFVLMLLWVIGFSLHVAFIHVLLIVVLMLLVSNFALGKRTL